MASFDGGLPLLDGVLKSLTDKFDQDEITFTDREQTYFGELKKGTAVNLESVISGTANAARRTAMFHLGGSPFQALAEDIAEKLDVSVGEAGSIASTGIATFYRTIADVGYKKIERALPKNKTLMYTYLGPEDRLNRPFCHNLLTQRDNGKRWTREEIDVMDNGSLPNVFRSAGSWRCRHSWLVALEN